MIIILPGRIPSKKNSKRLIWVQDKPRLISSEEYLQWEEEMHWRLKGYAFWRLQVENKKLSITMKLWAPDNRKADLSNKFESVADLLVKVGIISDDNWNVLSEVILLYQGVDKDNPRAEIELKIKAPDNPLEHG